MLNPQNFSKIFVNLQLPDLPFPRRSHKTHLDKSLSYLHLSNQSKLIFQSKKMCEEFFSDSFIDYWCITFQEQKSIDLIPSKINNLEIMMIRVVKLFNSATEDPEKTKKIAEDLFEDVKTIEVNESLKNPIVSFKKCLKSVAKRFRNYLKRSIHSTDQELIRANLGIVKLIAHLYNMGLDDGKIIFMFIRGELKFQEGKILYFHLLVMIRDKTLERVKNEEENIVKILHEILVMEGIV